jgi:16S rRNA processing protein RimM
VTAGDWDAMVTVGRIVRPQGRRGEVVVALDTDFAESRFQPGAVLWASKAGVTRTLTVTSSWPHQDRWVIALEGFGSIDEAETLRDTELRVPAEALQPLGEGAFYVHDLLGCRVETITGTIVGEVIRVDLGNGTPLLVVMKDGREVLVPLAEAICRRIDVGTKTIAIDPPEGLIEVNAGSKGSEGSKGSKGSQ